MGQQFFIATPHIFRTLFAMLQPRLRIMRARIVSRENTETISGEPRHFLPRKVVVIVPSIIEIFFELANIIVNIFA